MKVELGGLLDVGGAELVGGLLVLVGWVEGGGEEVGMLLVVGTEEVAGEVEVGEIEVGDVVVEVIMVVVGGLVGEFGGTDVTPEGVLEETCVEAGEALLDS